MKKKCFAVFVVGFLIICSLTGQQNQIKFIDGYTGDAQCNAMAIAADTGAYITGFYNNSGQTEIFVTGLDNYHNALWTKTYGSTDNDEEASSIISLNNGALLVSGMTKSFGSGGKDIYLIKTDEKGDTFWTKTYGGTLDDWAEDAIQESDTTYMVTGNTKSYGAGLRDIFLLKTNEYGDSLWMKTYGGAEDDYVKKIIKTSDGGYILCGTSKTYTNGNEDVFIIKVNKDGVTQWSQNYGLALAGDYGINVVQTAEGYFYITGKQYNIGNMTYDLCLIKTDQTGNELWTKLFGNNMEEETATMSLTPDNKIIMIGNRQFAAGNNNVCIIRTDTAGNVLDEKTIGDTLNYLSSAMAINASGNIIFTGSAEATTGELRPFMFSTGADLNSLWARHYSNTNNSWTSEGGIVKGIDDGFLFAGAYSGANPSRLHLVKTDDWGFVQWKEAFGGYAIDEYSNIEALKTNDDNYLIAFDTYNGEVFLVKVNDQGNELWSVNAMEGSYLGYLGGITKQGNDFVLAVTELSSGNPEMATVFVSGAGSVSNTEVYTATGTDDYAKNLCQTADNGFFVCGTSDDDMIIIKTDNTGAKQWEKVFSAVDDETPLSIKKTPFDNYLLTGEYIKQGFTNGDIFIKKLDDNAGVIWEKEYGGTGDEYNGRSILSNDSCFITIGTTNSFGMGNYDLMLFKTDTAGNMIWEKTFGGIDGDGSINICNTGNGYGLSGVSYSFYDQGKTNSIVIIKTDTAGSVDLQNINGSRTICGDIMVTLENPVLQADEYMWSEGSATKAISTNAPDVYRSLSVDNSNFIWFTDTFEIVSRPLPDIDLIASRTVACQGDSIKVKAENNDPGQTIDSYLWSEGKTEDSIFVTSTGEYYLTTTNSYSCVGVDTIELMINEPFDETICMVTVDTATNKNMVTWEKTPGQGIESYKVYKEVSLDSFEVIGIVPYDSLSVYVDTSSRPDERAAKYKIAVVDTCGNESALSPYHKTINLQVSQGVPATTYNLDWNHYVDESGLFTIDKYYIYRGNTKGSMALYDSISGSFTSLNDNNVTAIYYYYVSVRKTPSCDPDRNLKASAGPFSQSMSNLEDNRLKENLINEQQPGVFDLSLYPNPAKENINIDYKLDEAALVNIAVFAPDGSKIADVLNKEMPRGSNTTVFNGSNLSSGLFYIYLEVEGIREVEKIVVE